jgi:hypothetical protein
MTATGLEDLDLVRNLPLPVSERSREQLLDAMAVRLFRDHLAQFTRSFSSHFPPSNEAPHAQR